LNGENVSEPQTQNDSRLTVSRWLTTYMVPADHPHPQELRHRLDRAVDRFSENCAHLLAHTFDPQDPAVWRIRELAMDFSIDAGAANTDQVAQSWGQHLAARVQSMIAHGEHSDSILRFASPVAYLAQFIFDLSKGAAWGKWYYEEFESFRVFSVSQAIRTVILQEPKLAVGVILQLFSLRRLEDVLLGLTEQDAHEIYEACFENTYSASPAGVDKWVGTLLDLWNQAPLCSASREDNRFRDALRLFARTASRFPNAHGNPQFKLALDGLLDLRRVLFGVHSPRDLDSLIGDLSLGNLNHANDLARAAGSPVPPNALAFFARIMDGDVDWARQAASVVLSGDIQQKFLSASNILEGESLLSLFGGIFLLGPSLLQTRLGELTDAAAETCNDPGKTSSLLRHLVCIKCLGQVRAFDSASDPALRLFSGFADPSFSSALENVESCKLNLDVAARIFLQSLLDQQRAGPGCILAEIVRHSDREVLLIRDLAYNQWLDLIPIPVGQNGSKFIRARLDRLSEIIAVPPRLLLRENLASSLDISHLQTVASTISPFRADDDAFEEQLSGHLSVSRQRLSSLLKSSELEYSYFSPGFAADAHSVMDCTLSLFARAAIRHFVGRLIGFESSTPEYLYRNFLSGLGSIRHVENRLEVRLPASPLSLVLRMAGLQEQKYMPDWLEGREVWLLPPQE
jgi:hypothetical protein